MKFADMFGRLRVKLLVLALLVVVPEVAYIAYSAAGRRADAEVDAENNALNIVRQIAGRHSEFISLSREVLAGLSKSPRLRGARSADACNALVADLLRLHPRLSAIGTFQPNGELSCSAASAGEPVNVSDHAVFRHALATRNFVAGDYEMNRITGNVGLLLAYPVLGDNLRIVAVAFAAVDTGWIYEVMGRLALPEGSVVSLVNSAGTILAGYPGTPGHSVAGKAIVETQQFRNLAAVGHEGVPRAQGLDGVERIFAFAPIHAGVSGTSYLRIGIPTKHIYTAANDFFFRNMLVTAVLTLFLCAMLWFGSEFLIVGPIHRLRRAAARMKDGDLSARAGTDHRSGELAELAQTFDAMAAELESRDRKLRRVNRTLRMLSASHRMLLRADFEEALLQEMCRIAVDIGGYRLAWVGFGEHDERKSIRPVAYYGFNRGYIEKLNLTWDDTDSGVGPIGLALLTGRPCVVRQGAVEPMYSPWIQMAIQHGYRSFIALPLGQDGSVFGMITLYATEPDAFAEDEIEVLSELARDMGLGVKLLRLSEEATQREAGTNEA